MIQKSIVIFILSQTLLFGQNPIDYTVHIQPIITQNCVPCHKKGGIGPFSLEQYEDVVKRADFIAEVTQSRYMPPFPADKSFQHYANERGLKNEEIELIQKWVKSPPAPRGGSPKSEEKKLPTLVLAAENDDTIPLWHCETYAQTIPDATLHVIPKTSHGIPQNNPEAVIEVFLEAFLAPIVRSSSIETRALLKE